MGGIAAAKGMRLRRGIALEPRDEGALPRSDWLLPDVRPQPKRQRLVATLSFPQP